MKEIDFADDRALRLWCLEMGIQNNYGNGFSGIFETAERYYEFITGGKEIEVSIKDGETIQKITAPADHTGTKINLEVMR